METFLHFVAKKDTVSETASRQGEFMSQYPPSSVTNLLCLLYNIPKYEFFYVFDAFIMVIFLPPGTHISVQLC